MEEYLQYMKTFRSQMNDVEDQAAKISIEEQTHITTIQTLETDLDAIKSEIKQLKEDVEKMIKEKGEICSHILQKQKKIASLESNSSTLTQALDLIQRERASLLAKLVEKSTYYAKVVEDIGSKLQQQQDWVKINMTKEMRGQKMIEDKMDEQMTETEEMCGIGDHLSVDSVEIEARKALMIKLDSAKAKLDEFAQMKSKLVMENIQKKQSLEQVKCRANNFKAELLVMDAMTLEEEYRALLSDKDGETEYLQSLQDQIKKLKGISHVIKCGCGQDYKVEMPSSA